jgi:uncharacterized delta-60 repeat protein
VVQPDGKVIVGGVAYDSSAGYYRTVLVRYNADGSLDTGFGSGGEVLGGPAAYGFFSMALQPDGRIVTATYVSQGTTVKGVYHPNNNWEIDRYNADGSPDDGSAADTTPGDHFGTVPVATVKKTPIYGRVYVDFGGNDDRPGAVTISNGKIIVAGRANPGTTGQDFAVARLNADGSLDTTFDGNGKATFALPGDQYGAAVAVDTAGRIDVTGSTSDGRLTVVRFTSGGAADASFGAGGVESTSVPGFASSSAEGLGLTGDGRIVISGTASGPTTPGAPSSELVLARFTTGGSLDTTFGAPDPASPTGARTGLFVDPSLAAGAAMVVQPDGKVVTAYSRKGADGTDLDFRVVRVLADGSALDPTFGTGGLTDIDFGNPSGTSEYAQSLALDPGGRIVVAGVTHSGSGAPFAVARLQGDPVTASLATTVSASPGRVESPAALAPNPDPTLVPRI